MYIRWNNTTKYWEYDSSGGIGAGPWLTLPNIPYLNSNNNFLADQTINKGNPALHLYDANRPVNSRRFQIINTTNFLYFQAISDAIDASYGYIRIARDGSIYNTGSLAVNGTIIERNRTVPLGEWQDYTPVWKGSTSNSTSMGNGSLNGRYTLVGKTVLATIRLYSGTTSVKPVGYWAISMPLPIAGSNLALGQGWTYNGSSGIINSFTCVNGGFILGAFVDCAFPVVDMGGNAAYIGAVLWQPGIPFDWNANPNSYCNLSIMYETTSSALEKMEEPLVEPPPLLNL